MAGRLAAVRVQGSVVGATVDDWLKAHQLPLSSVTFINGGEEGVQAKYALALSVCGTGQKHNRESLAMLARLLTPSAQLFIQEAVDQQVAGAGSSSSSVRSGTNHHLATNTHTGCWPIGRAAEGPGTQH